MQVDIIESLLKKGRVFEAYNKLDAALQGENNDIRVQQLMGLTLARLGLLDRAKMLMEQLSVKENDSETSGILGRIYKDYWRLTGDSYYLKLSIATYLKAFLEKKDGYNGINAATLTYLSGDKDYAVNLAVETINYVNQWPDGYWKEATLGEAYLLTGDNTKAEEHYINANESGKGDPGSIHSTVGQLKLLSNVIDQAKFMINLFDDITVVIFAGHMVDNPERQIPRFPEESADTVKNQIGKFLDETKAKIGFSSLACGGDILFAESALERGMELNIILPFRIDDFLKTSVEFAAPHWKERFNAVLNKSHNTKFTTEEGYSGDDVLFELCAKQTMGLGMLRAGLFSAKPMLLTVWDDKSGSTGGTADSVKWFPWPDRHFNIHPGKYEAKELIEENISPQASLPAKRSFQREMKFILFSDISGFSKLDEESTPLFVLHYLKAISEKLKGFIPAPVVLNTWGDAVFAVMDSPVSLADYAFALQDAVFKTEWNTIGLPLMNVRIALHAGPVFLAQDPFLEVTNAYGSHINRAARMEPVTAPGSVYVSEQFAAALILEKKDDYIFDYTGIIELPKKFGKQEMFQLKKA